MKRALRLWACLRGLAAPYSWPGVAISPVAPRPAESSSGVASQVTSRCRDIPVDQFEAQVAMDRAALARISSGSSIRVTMSISLFSAK
jgi:hypothetical protein